MNIITKQQIPSVITNICKKGARPFTVLMKTDDNLLKKNRVSKLPAPEAFKDVKKVSLVNCILNFIYEASVNRQLGREGEEKDFQAQGMKGKEHDPEFARPIVRSLENPETKYLQLKKEKVLAVKFVDGGGEEMDNNELTNFLPARSVAKNQGVEKTIETFTVNLDNIVAFRVDGEEFFVGSPLMVEKNMVALASVAENQAVLV